ncbi:hypothetical protein V5097_18085 [Arenibacter palladensis]|uniref:hypothetical protein n=1 Tax=Arenibacter palladensis TaxID=237373 RepID=UPI002FD410D0
MKTTFYYCLLFMAVLCISSCSKGEDGQDGLPGPQGEQGPQGEAGTANIMYSDWMPLVWNHTMQPTFKGMLVQDEQVTEEFMDNGGLILVFVEVTDASGTTSILQLPWTLGNGTLDAMYVELGSDDRKGIYIRFYTNPDSDPLPDDALDGIVIRYFLIPGGTNLSGKGEMQTNWGKMTYEQVAALLAIPN